MLAPPRVLANERIFNNNNLLNNSLEPNCHCVRHISNKLIRTLPKESKVYLKSRLLELLATKNKLDCGLDFNIWK